jgi:RNA polymerase sigma-70 factor (ECF subfamily)
MLRRVKRRRERPLEEADPNARSGDTPDTQLERARARAWLDNVLDKMDHDLRVVFVLYELEGMNTPEVAELTGVPLGTAASRLRRAREAYEREMGRLRARLQRREGGRRAETDLDARRR